MAGMWQVTANSAQVDAGNLEEVASFPSQQVTGVTVSKEGRVFVNFPDWSDDHTVSVAEVVHGKPKPYPDEEWNKPGAPGTHFVCVQSVYVDDTNALWVLDPAAPKMKEIVKGGPKLLKVDLATNKVVQTIAFDEDAAPEKSYLNDVRVDTKAKIAFITDSGLGAVVVVDLKSGKARRLLKEHPSTKAEAGFKLAVDGRELVEQGTKEPPKINSDGIALDFNREYLYYHALTGRTLYRIKTEYLKDASLDEKELDAKVETVIQTPAPDGMIEGENGTVYLTDIESGAIVRFDPASKSIDRVFQDKRLQWPDTLAWGSDKSLYITASQIENMPRFNGGKSARKEPYKLFKLRLP
ncbi:MAG: major royal jelly-related protein [Chthoniobacteraceae bacterium]|nr:major royal jelly-related protein [Chthoniobacteraceae bacterium]